MSGLIGQTLEHCRVVEKIGEGGFGEAARERVIDTGVAAGKWEVHDD